MHKLSAVRTPEIEELERSVKERLRRTWVQQFALRLSDDGLVLCGSAPSYHAKQLVQHAVMQATNLPIAANEIAVVETRRLQRWHVAGAPLG